jgi:hypothetical protein
MSQSQTSPAPGAQAPACAGQQEFDNVLHRYENANLNQHENSRYAHYYTLLLYIIY